MATGWLRGTVKEVPSGDTVVVVGTVKGGPPPEKRITLSSLVAPKLGRRDGSSQDDAFAWQSREFLRQLCIGQACTFKVDYVLENIPGREFGSVFIGSAPDNVALTVAAQGWARVRSQGGAQSPYYDQLVEASTKAEGSSLGVFGKEPSASRKVTPAGTGFDAQEFIDTTGKGKPLPAVVEQVASGSMLRVTSLQDQTYFTIMVCGVQCPSLGRRPQAAAAAAAPAAAPTSNSAPESAAAVAASQPETPPEPFSREARHFTETKALNREVRVVLEGVDKFGNLFGSVLYPEDDQAIDLGLQLVHNGFAKVVEWGVNMMASGGHKLREAERASKQARKGIWTHWTPPATGSAKLSDNFTGTAREVVSGDCIVVADSASGTERRVTLSSIRAPKLGRRDEKPEAWAVEAKEFLRTLLIAELNNLQGKQVQVSLEYTRKTGQPGAAAAAVGPERTMQFGTITLSSSSTGSGNVAEQLLSKGLATIVRHRTDEERSAHYEALMEAEQAGKKNKQGLYSGKEAPLHHVNDVSLPGTSARAKQYLPFLQRGRTAGVVDFVITGHRLKINIRKEGVTIAFSPSGVRAPQRGQANDNSGRPPAAGEPYAEEALAFTRAHCLQRDVEIEVDTVDRGGTFLGTLRVPAASNFNLGLALLQAGLAKLHPSFDAGRVSGGRELAGAEEDARRERLKVWESYDPAANGAVEEDSSEGAMEPEAASVTVTDVSDGRLFYVQMAEEQRVAWLAQQLAAASLDSAPTPPRLRQGQLCAARFSLDQQWYRAKILSAKTSDPAKPSYDVLFVDFGNRESGLDGAAIRELDAATAAVPPQAFPASLACLQVNGLDDDTGHNAAQLLGELTGGGQRLKALILRKDRSSNPVHLHLLLYTSGHDDSAAESVNAQMLIEGVARLRLPPPGQVKLAKDVVESLTEAESDARKHHRGMWLYGDADEDEDEDDRPARKPAWGRK